MVRQIHVGHFKFLNRENWKVIFLITTKQPDTENIGKDTKFMFLGALEPVLWSSVICSKYMGGHIVNVFQMVVGPSFFLLALIFPIK